MSTYWPLPIWKISKTSCADLRVFASNENNVQLPVLVPNLIFKAPQKQQKTMRKQLCFSKTVLYCFLKASSKYLLLDLPNMLEDYHPCLKQPSIPARDLFCFPISLLCFFLKTASQHSSHHCCSSSVQVTSIPFPGVQTNFSCFSARLSG